MTDTAPPASIWRRLFEPRNLASMAPATRFVVYAGLLLWSFVVLFPLYWVVVTSFKLPIHVNDGPVYLPFVDFAPSVHAWRYIFVDVANDTFRPYLNSVIIASLSTLISMAVGAMAAYALTRIRYRVKLGLVAGFVAALAGTILATAAGVMWQLSAAGGLAAYFLFAAGLGRRFRRSVGNNDILFWILSNRILPPVVVVLPVYIMFQRLGLLDTHLAMILTYAVINLPIVVWLMRDFFAGIPLDLEESAEIDGASKFEILWTIVLPLTRAGDDGGADRERNVDPAGDQHYQKADRPDEVDCIVVRQRGQIAERQEVFRTQREPYEHGDENYRKPRLDGIRAQVVTR